jgi:hypothetical protein
VVVVVARDVVLLVSGLLVVVVVSSGVLTPPRFIFSFSRGWVVVVVTEGFVVEVVVTEGFVVEVVVTEGFVVEVVEEEGSVVEVVVVETAGFVVEVVVVDVGGVSNVASTATLSMSQYALRLSASVIMNRTMVSRDAKLVIVYFLWRDTLPSSLSRLMVSRVFQVSPPSVEIWTTASPSDSSSSS